MNYDSPLRGGSFFCIILIISKNYFFLLLLLFLTIKDSELSLILKSSSPFKCAERQIFQRRIRGLYEEDFIIHLPYPNIVINIFSRLGNTCI